MWSNKWAYCLKLLSLWSGIPSPVVACPGIHNAPPVLHATSRPLSQCHSLTRSVNSIKNCRVVADTPTDDSSWLSLSLSSAWLRYTSCHTHISLSSLLRAKCICLFYILLFYFTIFFPHFFYLYTRIHTKCAAGFLSLCIQSELLRFSVRRFYLVSNWYCLLSCFIKQLLN